MDKKQELTKQFIMVNINEMEISTDEKPIIGTQGLAPCVGFILHNVIHKRAIVGHISTDTLISEYNMSMFRINLIELLYNNNLLDLPLDLIIIEGAYLSKQQLTSVDSSVLDSEKLYYSLLEVLEKNIKQTEQVNIVSTKIIKGNDNNIQIVDEYGNTNYKEGATLSKQFAFDASSGKFVTHDVYFGKEYLEFNNLHIK